MISSPLRQAAGDDIVVTHKTFHAAHTGTLMGNWGIRDMSGIRPAH